MADEFGPLVAARRAELRLTLRDCASRAGIDPGNLSKIERGRLAPPQDPEVLNRLCAALEYAADDPAAQHIRDVAATQNGRIPFDITGNADVMASLPILLRTVNNKKLNAEQIEKLVKTIRDA